MIPQIKEFIKHFSKQNKKIGTKRLTSSEKNTYIMFQSTFNH